MKNAVRSIPLFLILLGCSQPIEVETTASFNPLPESVFQIPENSTVIDMGESPNGKWFFTSNHIEGYRMLSLHEDDDQWRDEQFAAFSSGLRLFDYFPNSHTLIMTQGQDFYQLSLFSNKVEGIPVVSNRHQYVFSGSIQYAGNIYDLCAIVFETPATATPTRIQLFSTSNGSIRDILIGDESFANRLWASVSLASIPGTDSVLFSSSTDVFRFSLDAMGIVDTVLTLNDVSFDEHLGYIYCWENWFVAASHDSIRLYDRKTFQRIAYEEPNAALNAEVLNMTGIDDSNIFVQLNDTSSYYILDCLTNRLTPFDFPVNDPRSTLNAKVGFNPFTEVVYAMSDHSSENNIEVYNAEQSAGLSTSSVALDDSLLFAWITGDTLIMLDNSQNELLIRHATALDAEILADNIAGIGTVLLSYRDKILICHEDATASILDRNGNLLQSQSLPTVVMAACYDELAQRFCAVDSLQRLFTWHESEPAKVSWYPELDPAYNILAIPPSSPLVTEAGFRYSVSLGYALVLYDGDFKRSEWLRPNGSIQDPMSLIRWSADGRFIYAPHLHSDWIWKELVWFGP